MNKNIIITGCNSTIGEHITSLFNELTGYSTYATYNIDDERIQNLKNYFNNISFKKLNLLEEIPTKTFPRYNFIIHCAAKSFNNNSDPKDIYNFNTISCGNISKFAQNTNTLKIIYLSSLSIYGKITTKTVEENTPSINPDTYGKSKLIGENIFKESLIPTVALRLPGVLAPRATRAWIPNCCQKLLRNEDVVIHNSEEQFNNLIEVTHLANFIHELINQNWSGFHAFPIGSKNPIRIKDIIHLLKNSLNSASNIREINNNQLTFNINSEYAKKHFNYEIPDTLESLNKYIEKMKN